MQLLPIPSNFNYINSDLEFKPEYMEILKNLKEGWKEYLGTRF